MKTATQVKKSDSKPVYRLPTQEKRAAFVRKEMRKAGLSILGLAEVTGLCWATVAKYADLYSGEDGTKDPRTGTTKKIFHALGYDLCFVSKESKGVIEL